MAASAVCVPGKAQTGFLQQFRRHLQIALGRTDINVSEISCQLRQQALHILARPIPGNHPVNRRGMSKIVHSWWTQFARRASDAVSYTHLRAHETKANLVCRLLLEK